MKKSMFTLLMTGVLFVGGAVPVQAARSIRWMKLSPFRMELFPGKKTRWELMGKIFWMA